MPTDNYFPLHMRLSALRMMTIGYGFFAFFARLLKPMLLHFFLLKIKKAILYFFPIVKKVYLQASNVCFLIVLMDFCMKHLEENFHKQFKNVELKKLLWKAARALTKEEFDVALENMKQINPRTVPWLYANANPIHWAELYFSGRRYGHLTSNIAESLNAKLLPACEMPILALLESIRSILMDWFSEKRQLEANTSSLIVRKVATIIQDAKNLQARRYRF